MAKFYTFGGGMYTLASSISSTQNTILLSSFADPTTGVTYTMAALNTDIVYATIGPRASSSEFVSFTTITPNADGTVTLGGVTRGLAKKYPFTTDAAYKLPHAGQSIFIISDVPQVFEEYSVIGNDETITGLKTFSQLPVTATDITPSTDKQLIPKKFYDDTVVKLTGDQTVAGIKTLSSFPITPSSAPTTDYQVANKKYADDLNYNGSPDMNTTTKGIGEEATQAEIDAGTQTGSTGAELIVNPKYLKDSKYYSILSGFGTPDATIVLATAYLAAVDGIVSVVATINYGYYVDIKIKSDASNPPTTIKAGASNVNNRIPTSVSLPVKKGQYWKVEADSDYGAVTNYTITWFPLGVI